jgi:hypothetical protein
VALVILGRLEDSAPVDMAEELVTSPIEDPLVYHLAS